MQLKRITFDPQVMGGKPCIRGMRVTVGTVVGLLAAGRSQDEILKAYPHLEPEDVREALAFAAWRADEACGEFAGEETGVGERGLAALTESTRDEDWSVFYPDDLSQRKAG